MPPSASWTAVAGGLSEENASASHRSGSQALAQRREGIENAPIRDINLLGMKAGDLIVERIDRIAPAFRSAETYKLIQVLIHS